MLTLVRASASYKHVLTFLVYHLLTFLAHLTNRLPLASLWRPSDLALLPLPFRTCPQGLGKTLQAITLLAYPKFVRLFP